jgi:ATP-dependent DNA helicase RecG
MERGVIQFESRIPPGATLADLDQSQVQAYLELLTPPGKDTWQQVLLRRGCLSRSEGELFPTYAGLLLFGCAPQQWLPSASILLARFSGMAFADEFVKQEATGSLPQQLAQAEAFLRLNLRSVVRMSGLTHRETPEYPLEAVRELLVNAVAHRDYNQQGDTIHVHLFSNRLEIHSPGGLPGPVTLENLLEARFARNAVITQVLSDLGFVERLGYGLDRVVAAMRQVALRPPRFEELAGTFRVTLYNDLPAPGTAPLTLPDLSAYQELELNPRQKQALVYAAQHKRISSRDYQELCPDVHSETLRRDLVGLVELGVLIKVGDKRATYYILKKRV